MKSLVLTRFALEPPRDGAALRNWQNIHVLSQFGPVDVVSLGAGDAAAIQSPARDWLPVALCPSLADRVRTGLWLMRPGVCRDIDRRRTGRAARRLRQMVGERGYDVVVVEGLSLAPYIRDLKGTGCRVVYDAHNVESALLEASQGVEGGAATPLVRLKRRLVAERFTSEERRAVTDADLVWACSATDAEELVRRFPGARRVWVVPNGIDLDGYRPLDIASLTGDWRRVPITMVYAGLFSYRPNEDAAMRLITRIVPAVRALGYAVRLVLVGRDPTPEMLDAARQDRSIEVTGSVPDVLPYLRPPCAVALPISMGSGTRLKVVEAFAAGAPVVSTAKGVEGIDVRDGQHLLIRESVASIAAAVAELWDRPELRASLCRNAFDFVRQSHSWSAAALPMACSLGLEPQKS